MHELGSKEICVNMDCITEEGKIKKMEFRKEDDIVSERRRTSKKKRIVMWIIIAFLFLSILVADSCQQRHFEMVRTGYEYMKEEQYDEAIASFETYLDVNSKAYWRIVEFINNKNYSQQGVKTAIRECKKLNYVKGK